MRNKKNNFARKVENILTSGFLNLLNIKVKKQWKEKETQENSTFAGRIEDVDVIYGNVSVSVMVGVARAIMVHFVTVGLRLKD